MIFILIYKHCIPVSPKLIVVINHRYIFILHHFLNICFLISSCTFELNIYRVFLFDDTFLTSSCVHNFEDIDMQFFANCRRRIIVFFYMQYVVIYSLFFLEIENSIFSFNLSSRIGPIIRWPHIAYRKNYYSSSTICKKLQVDIFKITPTGRSQKRIIKKKPLCIMYWYREIPDCILMITRIFNKMFVNF